MNDLDPESDAANASPGPSWKHWLVLTATLVLVAAAVLPPLVNISRYQRRIAASISSSIGRPVHMSTVRLRLLPWPGFEISDFEVEEDPAFGDEPMLRSASVAATVRLSSLWRGRLEMARIHFDEPSLNLVRDAQGRWNFDSVLVKASRSEIAPTAQNHPGAALRFPYVEGANARINFKQGYEKKPLSFLNSDVSVWLDRPEEWKLHFEAQPVRTDLDLALADTGTVRIDGTFHRAAELEQVPMVLHTEWTKAPLGQLTRLLAGRDMGWRGDLDVRADITGTPANARIKARIRANGVHRLEFAPLEPLDMDATCQGSYLGGTGSLEDLACTSPIGNGKLILAGAIHSLPSQPQPDVKLQMEQVPVSAVLESIRSVRSDFAPNLRIRGTVDGDFHFGPQPDFQGAVLDGAATVKALELTAPDFEKPLLVPQLRLTTSLATNLTTNLTTSTGKPVAQLRHERKGTAAPVSTEPALLLEPFALLGAGATPLLADARFTADRFAIHLAGAAPVKQLAALGRSFGILTSAFAPLAPQGTAEINLTVRGPWLLPVTDLDHPIATDTAEGTLELRNARIAPDFLPAPMEVISAHAFFYGDQVAWEPVAFTFAGLHGEGALRYHVPCLGEKGCDAHFDLHFASLDAATTEAALLGGIARRRTLKDLLARVDHRSRPWPTLNGTLSVGTLTLAELAAHDVKASLSIDGNHVQIDSLGGRALGGTFHVSGALDATGDRPRYALEGEFSKVNATEAAALFRERWGSGLLDLTTRLDLAGYTGDELTASAWGTYRWEWIRGSLAAGSGSSLSHFDRWQAEGSIRDKQLTLDHSMLTHGGQPMAVTGSISFGRELKLNLGPEGSAAVVSGTLQRPEVESPARLESIKRSSRTSP